MAEPDKDISMVDVSNALNDVGDQHGHGSKADGGATGSELGPAPQRRRSTLILTDEDQMKLDQVNSTAGHEDDKMAVDHSQTNLAQNSGPQTQTPGPQTQNQPQQGQNSTQNQHGQTPEQSQEPDINVTVPIEIKWTQGGEKVYVTGSFTGWRKMIGLARQPDNNFLITLGLPVGTHRFRFVIDNELRFSDFLPTATDQMGNFVNYVEVTPENVRDFLEQQESEDERSEIDSQIDDDESQTSREYQPQGQNQHQPQAQVQQPPAQQGQILRKASISRTSRSDSIWGLTNDDDDMGNGYSRYHDEENAPEQKDYQFITDIPPIFVDPKVMEQYYIAIDKQSKAQNGQQAWLHPPQLPPHLENVILNNFNSMDRDNNSGALPIPNHVVLNHLATTSIKNNTLSVASVVRYKRKYVTQVLYAPLQQ